MARALTWAAPAAPAKFSALRALFALVTAFAILYNITFRFNESLTSGRMAVAALLIWMLWSGVRISSDLDKRTLFVFLPVPYVLIQWLVVGDFGQVSRFLHLFLFSFVGALLVGHLAGDLRRFLWIVLLAVSIQAVFLFFSFSTIEYRVWLDSIIVTGGNFDALYLYRAPGFTSNAGSSLSLVQALGVLCGGWLLLISGPHTRRHEVVAVFSLMLLCCASCALVGRLGLYLSLSIFMLSIAYSRRFPMLLISTLVAVGSALYLSWPILESLVPADVSVTWLSNWALGVFGNGDQTLTALGAMPIERLGAVDSWTGHGLVTLIDGANPSGHDSGFIQAYYSMGFIFTALLYVAYLIALFRLLRWLPRPLHFILAVMFFALDVKEPFLFKYALMFVLVASQALAMRAPSGPAAR